LKSSPTVSKVRLYAPSPLSYVVYHPCIIGKTQVFHDKIQAKQAELAPWQQKVAEREGSLGVATRERDLLVSRGKNASQAVDDATASLQELKDEQEVKVGFLWYGWCITRL
jgi:hypothetical protein